MEHVNLLAQLSTTNGADLMEKFKVQNVTGSISLINADPDPTNAKIEYPDIGLNKDKLSICCNFFGYIFH